MIGSEAQWRAVGISSRKEGGSIPPAPVTGASKSMTSRQPVNQAEVAQVEPWIIREVGGSYPPLGVMTR